MYAYRYDLEEHDIIMQGTNVNTKVNGAVHTRADCGYGIQSGWGPGGKVDGLQAIQNVSWYIVCIDRCIGVKILAESDVL